MSNSTFSPDGQWMWTGSEWVPAPPTSPLGSNSTENTPVMVQQTELQTAENAGEIRLQQETLQEITSFTDWTKIFITSEYRKRKLWILFLIFVSPYLGGWVSMGVGFMSAEAGLNGNAAIWIVLIVFILCLIISWSKAFKRVMSLRNFNKENNKKKYSIIIFGNKSWTKQLDPMTIKYEHLVNWTYSKQNVETKRKLMALEIELKRLLKARRSAQVLTTVVAGVAVGAAAKGFSQATGRK